MERHFTTEEDITGGKYAHEEMLNISSHQGNANGIRRKLLQHNYQNG